MPWPYTLYLEIDRLESGAVIEPYNALYNSRAEYKWCGRRNRKKLMTNHTSSIHVWWINCSYIFIQLFSSVVVICTLWGLGNRFLSEYINQIINEWRPLPNALKCQPTRCLLSMTKGYSLTYPFFRPFASDRQRMCFLLLFCLFLYSNFLFESDFAQSYIVDSKVFYGVAHDKGSQLRTDEKSNIDHRIGLVQSIENFIRRFCWLLVDGDKMAWRLSIGIIPLSIWRREDGIMR